MNDFDPAVSIDLKNMLYNMICDFILKYLLFYICKIIPRGSIL